MELKFHEICLCSCGNWWAGGGGGNSSFLIHLFFVVYDDQMEQLLVSTLWKHFVLR